MPQSNLSRYLTYSFLIHISLVAWLTIANLAQRKSKTYYTVDFLGGMTSGAAPQEIEAQKPREPEAIKTKMINPEEDLLMKSKRKLKKNEREIISTVPPVPSVPVPKISNQSGTNISNEIPGTVPGSGIGIGFGTGGLGGGVAGNFPYTWYVHTIQKKLDSNWNVAAGFNARIYAQVAFTLRKDGALTALEIEETSKNEIFDRAAMRAIESSAPFPPLPSDFPESELRVHVRFALKR